ncbi:peptidoglycan/xylan/chitin deacetylase (PgdA/CDA1 family) [Elusimicrobium simillimum]|uniref:polysaccharide deacetylase family protein n=1 Tax=Elusimicrobium simillimum TaxID=3143438 RepID=UPI003C700A15
MANSVILFFILITLMLACAAVFIFTLWYLTAPKLTCLMYHHFGPVTITQEEPFFIDENFFETQLKYILSKGYTPISFETAEHAFINKTALPKKSILITFDDGWQDNYTHAYPVLKKLNIKANIFLNTAQIGIKDSMLTWEQAAEMAASGLVSFASHGMNHLRLRSLSDAEVLYELTESKKLIEERLGKPCLSFCYPFGSADKRVRSLVLKAGYIMDYGTRRGISFWPWKGSAPIKRIHVMRGENLNALNLQLVFGCKGI